MSMAGKKQRQATEKLVQNPPKTWKDAVDMVVKTTHVKFDETVDLHLVLGIDPAKGEQAVRGAILLPHGTGKKSRVVVFAKGEYEDKAKKAGADFVGAEDLIDKIQKGWMDFDVAVATPDLMGLVGKVARVLGPRGLLPNKKVGTVTFDVAGIVSELKQGRVTFKNDKAGGVHVSFGKVSFGTDKLLENLEALLKSIRSSKPATSKGKFIKKASIASCMGVGVALSTEDVG